MIIIVSNVSKLICFLLFYYFILLFLINEVLKIQLICEFKRYIFVFMCNNLKLLPVFKVKSNGTLELTDSFPLQIEFQVWQSFSSFNILNGVLEEKWRGAEDFGRMANKDMYFN